MANLEHIRGLLAAAPNPAMRDGLLSTLPARRLEVTPQVATSESPKVFNNPGNVEATENWTGAIPGIGYQHGEVVKGGRHAIFNSPVLGVRALFRDVKTKMDDFDGNASAIITKYAPEMVKGEKENDTAAYIKFVRGKLGLKSGNQKITEAQIPDLVKAIIQFENDRQDLIDLYLSDEVFDEAKRLSKHSLTGGGDLAAAQAEHDIKESQ
jgi:hypothetical protein